ncbi:MAG: GHKL domain-containing protein [Lachnospiraceae bacterium]|nr:GHKL domain-containing protein [Lachnospiraceae bacterium]
MVTYTNVLPDIPRLYTAIAEWGACVLFILLLPRRFPVLRLTVISGAALLLQCLLLVLTGEMKTFYLWIFIMIVAAFLMAVFLFQCCRVNWWEALYCALQAFVLAEFTTSLSWQIYCFYFYSSVSVVKGFPLFLLFCAIIYPVYWWMLHRRNKTETGMDIYTRDVISVLFITVLTFFVSNLSYIPSYFSFVTPFTTGSGETIATLRTMMDLGGVAMMYAHYVTRCEMHDREELKMMDGILESQYQQYQQSKESIELVNYKYHDLKHQIEILRMESDPQKREKYLNEMEEDIRQFEVQNKTGNKVLDTLLTGKSITCQRHQIAINCVADGKLLDFIDTMDLCAILGNALDNAIECEMKISDPEKRLIHVAIFSQKNFVIMWFENYFDGELSMNGDMPVTTKDESGFHGYGVKSIRHTAKKYNGAASISVKDGWFELKILIPMPTEG